uniref:Uncharacterized protein n=1 Tax=Ciona savignyi TaxID=51511 RepID=H2YIU4_CIOSA
MTGAGETVNIQVAEQSKEQPDLGGNNIRKMEDQQFRCGNRTVSASIEVPKPCRMRKTSEEPTMTELMAAMVLSNLSTSPVFHIRPNK